MKNSFSKTTVYTQGYTLDYVTTSDGAFSEATLHTEGMIADLPEAAADIAMQAVHYDNTALLLNFLHKYGGVRPEFL